MGASLFLDPPKKALVYCWLPLKNTKGGPLQNAALLFGPPFTAAGRRTSEAPSAPLVLEPPQGSQQLPAL